MDNSLSKLIGNAAFAFRGYNVTNLGRTPELLEHRAYGPVIERYLREASRICEATTGRPTDLVTRMRNRVESTLDTYPEDIALTIAVEQAHLELLEQFFDVKFSQAKLAFGYSLGEVAALVAAKVYELEAVLTPLLKLADDAADLAHDVTLGVLFSRGPALDFDAVQRLCLQITNQGQGAIAVSTYLSPNTVLLLGQGETVDQFKGRMHEVLPKAAHLRGNPHRWPPMHTPITWQRNIPNRAGVMLDTAAGGFTAPNLRILSCVTGDASYNDYNSREIMYRWVDSPQLLWNVVERTLAEGVDTIIHVGPEANIIPSTFTRLANNVTTQMGGRSFSSLGMRAMSRIVRRHRRWLASVLSSNATLLRAPFIEQINVEDWLLNQEVPS